MRLAATIREDDERGATRLALPCPGAMTATGLLDQSKLLKGLEELEAAGARKVAPHHGLLQPRRRLTAGAVPCVLGKAQQQELRAWGDAGDTSSTLDQVEAQSRPSQKGALRALRVR